LLAFHRRNFRAFLLAVASTMCVREDASIALVGFGLQAALARYPARWALAGTLLPAGWWALATFAVQPTFGRQGNSSLDVALAGGEASPLGLFHQIAGDLTWVIAALGQDGIAFLHFSLAAVGALALLGLEAVIALP